MKKMPMFPMLLDIQEYKGYRIAIYNTQVVVEKIGRLVSLAVGNECTVVKDHLKSLDQAKRFVDRLVSK